jgi:hypothetical protein
MNTKLTEIIKLGKLINENWEEKVFFDLGPITLKGKINHETIPERFSQNYKDIITKSFCGYTDESINIVGKLIHPENDPDYKNTKYNITINFTTKFYSFDNEIIIPLEPFNKDRTDYLEEKITYLTSKLESIELILTELMASSNIHKSRFLESRIIDQVSNESDDSSIEGLTDSEEVEVEVVHTKKKSHKSSSKSSKLKSK